MADVCRVTAHLGTEEEGRVDRVVVGLGRGGGESLAITSHHICGPEAAGPQEEGRDARKCRVYPFGSNGHKTWGCPKLKHRVGL